MDRPEPLRDIMSSQVNVVAGVSMPVNNAVDERQDFLRESYSREEGGDKACNGSCLVGLDVVLDKCVEWDSFDVFELDAVSGNSPLQTIMLYVLKRRGIIERMDLDVGALERFLEKMESVYSNKNPYHCSIHAADVVQAIVAMMQYDSWANGLEDWEVLALLLSAAGHDAGHDGVTNDFHLRANSDWARKYGSLTKSVNEYGHASITLGLLDGVDTKFFKSKDDKILQKVKEYVRELILLTDMSLHRTMCEELKAISRNREPNIAEWPRREKLTALGSLLHLADISNPGRPWSLCYKWGRRVQEELFLQGDRENQLGLSPSPRCTREERSTSVNQLAFIKSVIKPFCTQMSIFAPNFIRKIDSNVNVSLERWETFTVK